MKALAVVLLLAATSLAKVECPYRPYGPCFDPDKHKLVRVIHPNPKPPKHHKRRKSPAPATGRF